MPSAHADPVKEQVAAHWDRRAAHFDEDFGHSIRTPAERAAWERIFGLVLPGAGPLDALDLGCGTGFLSLELASRGHRVTGVDFAPAMIARAEQQGGRARPRGALRARRRRAIAVCAGELRPGDQPPCAVDLAASRSGDRRVDPRAAAGRAARCRRWRGARRQRPGRGRAAGVPGKRPHQPGIRRGRRPAAVSRRAAARADRGAAAGAQASSRSPATRSPIWSRRRCSAWPRRGSNRGGAIATSSGATFPR